MQRADQGHQAESAEDDQIGHELAHDVSVAACPRTSKALRPLEALVGWRDLGDEVAQSGLVRQRLERHLAFASRVVQAYTVLPSTRIMHSLQALALMQEKRMARRRVAVHADPAQAVEHGLPRLERHLVVLVAAGFARRAAAKP